MPTRLDRLAAHLSAKQTAALCLCGGLISASGSFAERPLHKTQWHGSHLPVQLQLAIVFSLMLFGYVILVYAKSEIESGIAAARWPDDEIESLRNLVTKELIVRCSVVLLIALVILVVLQPRHNLAFWGCFILGQSLTQLNVALRPPRETPTRWLPTNTAGWPDDAASLVPIQSQHWGER